MDESEGLLEWRAFVLQGLLTSSCRGAEYHPVMLGCHGCWRSAFQTLKHPAW